MNNNTSPTSLVIAQKSSYCVVKASGKDLLTYIQGQITQDIALLSTAQAIYAAILTPQAKAVSDFYVLQAEQDAVLFLCPTATVDAFVERLRRFSLGYQLRMGMLSKWQVMSVQGEGCHAFLQQQQLPVPQDHTLAIATNDAHTYILNMPECASQGVWVVSEQLGFAANSEPESIEQQRILQAIPEFGTDWDSSVLPLNANLIERQGVSFEKGCYVGQEVTSRMHWRKGIKKKLYQVEVQHFSHDLPCPISTSQAIGQLTSLATNHAGKHLGIALLPIATVAAQQALSIGEDNAVHVIAPCSRP